MFYCCETDRGEALKELLACRSTGNDKAFLYYVHALSNMIICGDTCGTGSQGKQNMCTVDILSFIRMIFYRFFFKNCLFHLLHAHVAPKPLVPLTSQIEVCSARIRGHRQTNKPSFVTLTVLMSQRLIKILYHTLCYTLKISLTLNQPRTPNVSIASIGQ